MVTLNRKKEKSIWASFLLVNTSLDKRVIQARMVLNVTLWRIFRKISKFQNIENCMPRTDTYDKLTSTNAFSHLPLSNLVIFLISLIIKCHNVTFWGTQAGWHKNIYISINTIIFFYHIFDWLLKKKQKLK